jgi:hypothetical protein
MLKGTLSLLLLLFLGGCALVAPETGARAPISKPDPAQGLADLRASGARFRELTDISTPDGCQVANAVELQRLASGLNRPATMSCPTALALARFDSIVLRPLAREYLGQSVRTIHHVGAYDCRNQRDGKRISQHGLGQAIDLWAIELGDGTILKIRDDWRGKTASTTYLRKAAKGACDIFHLVLTPSSDYDHKDHLHLDLGPWKRCW